jgi:aerobic carbon-monoxide dehydrogenase medium subunit
MKPASFEYVRPAGLTEAVSVLSDAIAAERDAQVLAGGQSLLAMMSLRVCTPDLLVDISRLAELSSVHEEADAVRIGSGVTHAAIEDEKIPDPSRGLMASVARHVAYRAVRTRGTIGGSLALSDPAADWVTVMQALGAKIALLGPRGRREIDAAAFTTGIYETVRASDEIIESILVPRLSASARWGFAKFCRRTGEFAHSIVAVVIDPPRRFARVAVGGSGATPACLGEASQRLGDGASQSAIELAAGKDLAARDDFDDEFQSAVHGAMMARALSQALP